MEKITESVVYIGNRFFNFYIAGRKNAALIEGGTNAAVDVFARQWNQWKDKPEIKYLVLMHSHFDHVCGVLKLKGLFPEAQVVASPETKKFLARDQVVRGHFANDKLLTQLFWQHRLLDHLPDEAESDTIAVDITVSEGDVLELGEGKKLTFFTAPGHSVCSIAAYFEPDRVMFTSDAVCTPFSDGSMYSAFYSSYSDFINSIKKLQQFPTEVIAPGHGAWAQGADAVQQYYSQALQSSQNLFDYIKKQVEENNYPVEEDLIQHLYQRYVYDIFGVFPKNLMIDGMRVRVKRVKQELKL